MRVVEIQICPNLPFQDENGALRMSKSKLNCVTLKWRHVLTSSWYTYKCRVCPVTKIRFDLILLPNMEMCDFVEMKTFGFLANILSSNNDSTEEVLYHFINYKNLSLSKLSQFSNNRKGDFAFHSLQESVTF